MPKPETPRVSACVIGQDGDVIVTIFEKHCTLQVRNPHTERNAIVDLRYEQAQVVRDVLDQMSPEFMEDDDD